MDIDMTPEERFTRIENFLSTVTEHQAHMAGNQARHDEDIREIRQFQKSMTIAITKVAEAHRQTEEAQRLTERSLKSLIDKVDRIVPLTGNDPV